MNYLLTTAYLPPLQYMVRLYHGDKIWIEQHDHYVKQTYRNRTLIAAENGPLPLTIPVLRTGTDKRLVRDLTISDHGRWQQMHWRAIVAAYDNSPYFYYYADEFRPFFEKKYTYLVDFNAALLNTVFDLLAWHPCVRLTDTYVANPPADVEDARETIHPKRDWRLDAQFVPQPYHQVFETRHGFLPNLSILDLLFNMGPESRLILRNSWKY